MKILKLEVKAWSALAGFILSFLTIHLQVVVIKILSPGQPLSKKFKMIGNGVPVPLAKAVASQLLNFIKKLKDK